MHELEDRLGYSFSNASLLECALTHTSHADASHGKHDFERLEFLGDAVLGMVVSEMLYHHYPDEREGDLAKRKSALVSRKTLVKIAKLWGLDQAVRLSRREEAAGGRETRSTLEDACEAVLGAIYLDGGFLVVKELIERAWGEEAQHYIKPPKDARTELQEWAQGRGLPLPEYDEVARSGEAHAPVFVIEVRVDGYKAEKGEGVSKKQASANAAKAMLKTIESQL